MEDLGSLSLEVGEGLIVPAAGAPWYMALLGRDALIIAYQAMLLGVEPAKNVLKALARYQAGQRDDFFFGEVPQIPYHGTADATPLFLILPHEVWRWDSEVGVCLRDGGCGAPGAGLDPRPRRPRKRLRGLRCPLAGGPSEPGLEGLRRLHALPGREPRRRFDRSCEVQGYVYDAFLRTAELADRVWEDQELAREIRADAEALRERFDWDFWMEDRGYYALALDGAGRKVDSITSNPGHLLWSDIVPAKKTRLVADGLMGEVLSCGWGIRTMAASEGGYDPGFYHNDSVWPHDKRRHRLRPPALRVSGGGKPGRRRAPRRRPVLRP